MSQDLNPSICCMY